MSRSNYDPDEAARAGPPRSGRWDFNPASSTQVKFASSLSDLARFKSTVKSACKEYVQSGDSAEFCRIVNSLGMSVYHQDLPHILIKYRSETYTHTQTLTRTVSDLTR